MSAYTPARIPPALSRHLGNRYPRKAAGAAASERRRRASSPRKRWRLVVGTDLIIAVGDEQECRQTADTSPDEFQEIERRVVCPVDVFDHDRAWRGRQIELGEGMPRRRPLGRDGCFSATASGPFVCLAMSCTGPSGRGVESESHRPQSAPPVQVAAKCSTRLVLPTPASPAMAAIRPAPFAASSSQEEAVQLQTGSPRARGDACCFPK